MEQRMASMSPIINSHIINSRCRLPSNEDFKDIFDFGELFVCFCSLGFYLNLPSTFLGHFWAFRERIRILWEGWPRVRLWDKLPKLPRGLQGRLVLGNLPLPVICPKALWARKPPLSAVPGPICPPVGLILIELIWLMYRIRMPVFSIYKEKWNCRGLVAGIPTQPIFCLQAGHISSQAVNLWIYNWRQSCWVAPQGLQISQVFSLKACRQDTKF